MTTQHSPAYMAAMEKAKGASHPDAARYPLTFGGFMQAFTVDAAASTRAWKAAWDKEDLPCEADDTYLVPRPAALDKFGNARRAF